MSTALQKCSADCGHMHAYTHKYNRGTHASESALHTPVSLQSLYLSVLVYFPSAFIISFTLHFGVHNILFANVLSNLFAISLNSCQCCITILVIWLLRVPAFLHSTSYQESGTLDYPWVHSRGSV